MTGLEYQRRVASVLLAAIGDAGFALAGSSAIREHGLTDRPTQDVDLFADTRTTAEGFRAALTRGEAALQEAGFRVSRIRSFPLFARIRVDDPVEGSLEVDFAVNWRQDPPTQLSLGLVVSERDAVAGKLSAVYSRGEVRDFLDLDAIRRSGHYTDAQLLAIGREDDDGFDESMFAQQLSRVANILPTEVEEYEVTPAQLAAAQRRIMAWAVTLRDGPAPPTPLLPYLTDRRQQLARRPPSPARSERPSRPGRTPPPLSF